jgi:hypothetical protein
MTDTECLDDEPLSPRCGDLWYVEGAKGVGIATVTDTRGNSWMKAPAKLVEHINRMDTALRDIRKAITESRTQPERVWSIGDILDTAGY